VFNTVPIHHPEQNALQSAYRQNGTHDVAYLDESYRIEPSGQTYYIITAAVIEHDQRDIVRRDIVRIAATTYWHTTNALQTNAGRTKARELLDYLGGPSGTETAFIAHQHPINADDHDGEAARETCLTAILHHINKNLNADLFVLERRLTRMMENRDARTKKIAITQGLIRPSARLFQTSPSTEPLLWIPDLICSAYRHSITQQTPDLYQRINALCTVLPQT